MKVNENFLKDYLNSNSPTGFEYELGGQKLWMEYISKFVDKVEIDVVVIIVDVWHNGP